MNCTECNTPIGARSTSGLCERHYDTARKRRKRGKARLNPDLVPTVMPATGKVTVTSDGGSFEGVKTTVELGSDWSQVFRTFKLDPDVFEIVDDTVRMTYWEQSKADVNGVRSPTIGLYSYSARFKRRSEHALADELVAEHRAALRAYQVPRFLPTNSAVTPCAAVINLADIQGGKSEGGGVAATRRRLEDGLLNVVAWLERCVAAGRNIDEVVLVNNGDPLEGCAGNYAAQLFTVELNHRGQHNFVLDVWEMYARELFPRFDRAQFVSVLCNHGELGRFGAAKNQTSDSDNAGGLLADCLRRVLHGRPDFAHVQWTIPHDEMTVYPTVSGVPMAFNHGHKVPGSDASGFEKWLNGQVRGDADAHAARIWQTAHRHHFAAWDMGSCSVFQAPSLDGGSKWLKDMTGKYSRAGILAYLVGEHDPLGWSDLAFL